MELVEVEIRNGAFEVVVVCHEPDQAGNLAEASGDLTREVIAGDVEHGRAHSSGKHAARTGPRKFDYRQYKLSSTNNEFLGLGVALGYPCSRPRDA